MKASEFRDQSVDELNALLKEKRKERFKLINQREKEKKMDKPHLPRAVRKDIARILTVLTEKAG
jgi:large subunit ribosomal protein L29